MTPFDIQAGTVDEAAAAWLPHRRHGGDGVSEAFQAMRPMANLDTVDTDKGPRDVHALIRGRAQTGLQAFF